MAFAVGGTTSSRSPWGSHTIDARDYGVQADGNDCSAALQAAVDAAMLSIQVRDGTTRRAMVHVPSAQASYVLNNPVYIDSDNVGIQGEGRGVTCFATGQFPQKPGFVLGLPRGSGAIRNGVPNIRYGALDASYRLDLFGKLDTTAVSAPNIRWGIRTKHDSIVQVQCGALLLGWQSLRKFTIELCLDSGNGGQPMTPSVQIMGRGDSFAPAPWLLSCGSDGSLAFSFRTSDQVGPGNPRRGFVFPLTGVGPYRISVQIDMDLGQSQAYVNGVQVGITNGTWPPGLSLFYDDWKPFILGYSEDGERFGGVGSDISFLGFLLANGLRYKNNGIGKVQRCVDSIPILGGLAPNDGFRFYGMARYDIVSGDTLVRLSTLESPSSLDRMVTFNEGPGLFDRLLSGYFINQGAWLGGGGGISNNTLRGFTIGGKGHAVPILVGGVLGAQIQDIRAFGGWNGIGSINLGANYTVDVQDCFLSGTDAAYYGFWQILKAQNLFFESYGNTIMRLVGSNLSLRDFFATSSSSADTFFKFHKSGYGGGYSLTDGWINTEGETLTDSAIHFELHPFAQSYLNLKNIQLGTIGTAPVIRIRDTGNYNPPSGLGYGWLASDNLTVISSGPYIDIDGSRCFGEVKGAPNFSGVRLVHEGTFGTDCNIVIQESGYTGPPRTSSWYPGAHSLENRRPADGQYIEWRCIKAGVFGTPIPPTFVGTSPSQLSPDCLASYVLNHMYISVELN